MKRLLIGLAISLVALWLAFRKVDWQAFWETLTQGNILWIVAGSAALLAAIPLRGIRWRIFMEPVKRVSLRQTSEATLVGYFGNNALPFRLGELLRTYFLARVTGAPLVPVLGTVIVERIVDIISILLILAFMPLFGAIPGALRRPVLWAVVFGTAVALITVWLVRREKDLPFVTGWLKGFLGQLRLAFNSLRQARHYLTLLITTIGIWGFYFLSIYSVQRALDLGLSPAGCYLVLVATTLVLLVPAAPGFVGTFHAAVVLALVNILSVDQARAQAMAVILHAVGFIPYTVLGALSYFRSHLHMRDLKGLSWQQAGEAES